ncbi:MAG TPA: hypothetical protein V6C65_01705 [Allocoleopsis sp.]
MKVIYLALTIWFLFSSIYTLSSITSSIASFAQSLAAPQIHQLP